VTSLLGLTFSDLTAAQSATRLAERPASSPFGYVVTPNADHLVRISRDAGLCELYRNAILCQLDSRVVGGLAWLLGLTAPVVAPGSDLTAELLTRHLQPGERITIIGLSPVWLQALVRRFGLAAPAHYDPPMGFDRYQAGIDAAVAFVVANPARFVFLAVGSRPSLPAATQPGSGCVSARVSNSWRVRAGGRRGYCSEPGWSGCTGF
jgi:N-acetylglucosaminyldiphosphoundecaprenol N-acetyl-beta-D-mannosaminyltransferase